MNPIGIARSMVICALVAGSLTACGSNDGPLIDPASSRACQLLTAERASQFVENPIINSKVDPASGNAVCNYSKNDEHKDEISLTMLGPQSRGGEPALQTLQRRDGASPTDGLGDLAAIGNSSIEWAQGELTYRLDAVVCGDTMCGPLPGQQDALLRLAKSIAAEGPLSLEGGDNSVKVDGDVCNKQRKAQELVAQAFADNGEERKRLGWGPETSEALQVLSDLLDQDTGNARYLVENLQQGVTSITGDDRSEYDSAAEAFNAACDVPGA